MEKVILTKRQSEALESFTKGTTKDLALKKFVQNLDIGWEYKDYLPFNDMELEVFCKALYVGYEVEETKEERIISYIEYIEANEFTDQSTKDQKLCTLLNVLNILGVEIKGVNQ